MDGILNIDKSAGMTSFQVVTIVRRLSGERRVGHSGTLDPDATGVLPVCLGRATRLAEFLVDTGKEYRAVIRLGIATDTYDASGRVTLRGDPSSIDLPRLETALERFRGDIRQTPPMYSALKYRGRPLYEIARAGVTIARPARKVTIDRLEITAWDSPELTLEVACSKGTYVRSLAHDLGEDLGCGAHLVGLVRTRSGGFCIDDAATLEQIEAAFDSGGIDRYLYPPDTALRDYPVVTLDETGEAAFKQGSLRLPTIDDAVDSDYRYCRAYAADGRFLGILRRDKESGGWRPGKVFS